MTQYLNQQNTDFQFTDVQLAAMNANIENYRSSLDCDDDGAVENAVSHYAERLIVEGN